MNRNLKKFLIDYKAKITQAAIFCDLPQTFTTFCSLPKNKSIGSGSSFSFNISKIKAIYEFIERDSLYLPSKNDVFRKQFTGDYNYVTFSQKQLKNERFNKFKLTHHDTISYTKGVSLQNNTIVDIPASLIFLNNFKQEKIIRLPISTGASSGNSLEEALVRGILEIIERDAFMIHYLAQTFGELIDYSKNTKLKEIQDYLKKYQFDLYLINLPTDININTIMAFVIDITKANPIFISGMKSHFNPTIASIGAIEEALQSQSTIRVLLNRYSKIPKIIPQEIITITDRQLFWSSKEMFKYIVPWIENKRKITLLELKEYSKPNHYLQNLDYLKKELLSKGQDILYREITKKEYKNYGIFVVKTIIPGLQPMHLNENYKYLGGNRIYNIPKYLNYYHGKYRDRVKLNNIPHFFL